MNFRLWAIVSVLFHAHVAARLLPALAEFLRAVSSLAAWLVVSALMGPLGRALGFGRRSGDGARPLGPVL